LIWLLITHTANIFFSFYWYWIRYSSLCLLQDAAEVAKRVKEMYSYVCPDIAKEFVKFDKQPEKFFKQYSGIKVWYLYEFRWENVFFMKSFSIYVSFFLTWSLYLYKISYKYFYEDTYTKYFSSCTYLLTPLLLSPPRCRNKQDCHGRVT